MTAAHSRRLAPAVQRGRVSARCIRGTKLSGNLKFKASLLIFCFSESFTVFSPRPRLDTKRSRVGLLRARSRRVKRHRAALKLSLYHHVTNSIKVIDQRSGLGTFLHEYTGRKWLLF